MKQLSAREKKIALVCAAMIVVYAGYQIWKHPAQQRDRGLLKTIAERRQTLEKNGRMIKEAKAIEQKYQAYAAAFGQKGSEEQETSSLISDIETMAGKVNVKITNMQPQKPVAREGYKEIGIQIVISGSLLSIVQFVHELQDQPYFLDLSEVQLQNPLGPNGTVQGRLTFVKALVNPR
jgi:Tfp pilus assembly protein PilO